MVKLNNTAKILSIAEVSIYFPQQWAVIDITQRDKYGWPEKGEVIACSPSKQELIQKTKNLSGDLYLFYTGRIDDVVA